MEISDKVFSILILTASYELATNFRFLALYDCRLEDAVVAYDSGLTAVQALNNGQVDAVVIDNAPAKEYVAANPGLKVLETSYAEEDYAIGMAKGSSLEDVVNAALEELKADGTLQSIVDKYITAE